MLGSAIDQGVAEHLRLIDNQVTVIGGRNIGDEYFGAGGALFVDLDTLAVGPLVQDTSRDFDV